MTTWGPGWGPTNQIRCALETRDRRPGSSSSIAVSPSLSSPRDIGGQAPFISVWDLDHCHVTFTIHKGIFSQICKSTNMKLWVNKSPSLVRHPISPTVCSTNIWRMEQVIKRIAFPSCFVTSLCHFNFSSRLYRLDTGMWISICGTNKRSSLFSELLQFNIIQ